VHAALAEVRLAALSHLAVDVVHQGAGESVPLPRLVLLVRLLLALALTGVLSLAALARLLVATLIAVTTLTAPTPQVRS
jgi:hypothetical protein